MSRTERSTGGFSLMEVTTALGVISFALVALIGVFPLGLENSRLAVGDTRATQIVKTIAATLSSERFTAADCFSPTERGMPPLDFSTLGREGGLNPDPDVVLYATYDVTALPRVVRANQPPPEAIYRVEMRCRRENFIRAATSPAAAGSRVTGTNINLRIAGLREKRPFAENWIFLPNLAQP